MARLSILLTLAFASQLSLVPADRPCPAGWTAWGDSCYLYSGYDKLTWDEALARCRSYPNKDGLRADLVSIHSQAEEDFVYHYWRASSPYVADPGWLNPALWIGMTDIHQYQGSFKWSDETSADFQNWGPGEPLAGDHADLLDFGNFVNKWNDLPGTYVLSYMCKMAQ